MYILAEAVCCCASSDIGQNNAATGSPRAHSSSDSDMAEQLPKKKSKSTLIAYKQEMNPKSIIWATLDL